MSSKNRGKKVINLTAKEADLKLYRLGMITKKEFNARKKQY